MPPAAVTAAAAVIGVVLVLLAAGFLDAASVGWAKGLPPWLRGLARTLTDIGQSHWSLVPSGVVLILFFLGDWRRVTPTLRLAWLEVAALAVFVFAAVAGSGLFVDLVKLLVGRGRPAGFFENGAFSFSPLTFGYLHASFPSGHSTTLGALCVVFLSMPFGRSWRIGVVTVFALLATTRILVGAHYPSDVATGFLVGASFAYVVALLLAGAGFSLRPNGRSLPRIDLRHLRRAWARPGGGRALWRAAAEALRPGRNPASR